MLKKRFDGKPLRMLSMLLVAVCLSMFASSREEDWTLNPSDFRYDMSLYFTVDPSHYANLEANEIAAFIDGECRGVAERLELPENHVCLYMRIRSNESAGEEVSLYVREKGSSDYTVLSRQGGESIAFESDAMLGLPSEPVVLLPVFSVEATESQNGKIEVEAGQYTYGSVVEFTAVADTGYHFELWSDESRDNPHAVTVTGPVNLSATFLPNSYNLTFNIGDQLFQMKSVLYGDPIEAPEVPEKEGYIFAGWGDVPATMPAEDLVFNAIYEPIKYKITFVVDGEVLKRQDEEDGDLVDVVAEVAYGTPLSSDDFLSYTPADKEGYTFSGWSGVPATMPNSDIQLTGTFNVNSYRLTFMLNGEIFEMFTLPYGSTIVTPTPPILEGQTFDGWGDVPETMPAQDLVFSGNYAYNGYKITFIVDDDVLAIQPYTYGAEIVYPEVPEKEGHSFSGWDQNPEKMPAQDLTITGEYVPNLYKALFYIDGELYKEDFVSFGATLVYDTPEEKEGYTFSGWGEILDTMPACDVEFYGQYMANTYKVTLLIDDSVYEILSFLYGNPVQLPEIPEKEGYTFSGFANVPETMPAFDVELTANYIANFYKLTVYVNDEIYMEDEVPYGEKLNIPTPEIEAGYEFTGWDIEIPENMPAYDLVIHGTVRKEDIMVGVETVTLPLPEIESIYDLEGHRLPNDADLTPGVYVINGKKVLVK